MILVGAIQIQRDPVAFLPSAQFVAMLTFRIFKLGLGTCAAVKRA
jgi:hypothetical protein